VGAEESDDEAIRRTATEMGIRPEDIGFVDLWYLNDESPRRPIKQVDFGGHAGVETLRGYVRFEDLLLEILAERKERKAAEDSVSSKQRRNPRRRFENRRWFLCAPNRGAERAGSFEAAHVSPGCRPRSCRAAGQLSGCRSTC